LTPGLPESAADARSGVYELQPLGLHGQIEQSAYSITISLKAASMENLVGRSNDPGIAAVFGEHTAGQASVIGHSNNGRYTRN